MNVEVVSGGRRVIRINRVAITALIIAILLPTILCIVLFVRMDAMQKQIDSLSEISALQSEALKQEETVANENQMSDTSEMAGDNGTTNGNATVKTVYLTFDDGPSSNTAEILDILKEYNVKATFFVTGKTGDMAEEMYRRIVEEGHTLGMHSYSHRYSVIYESVDAFAEDLTKLQSYLEEVTGVKPMLYRFPGGSSNLVSKTDMQDLIAYLHEQGIEYYDWNVACGDATGAALDAEDMVDNVMNDIPLYTNSVVLLHDATDKKDTVRALPDIITQLQEQGVALKALDETVEPVHHIKVEPTFIERDRSRN